MPTLAPQSGSGEEGERELLDRCPLYPQLPGSVRGFASRHQMPRVMGRGSRDQEGAPSPGPSARRSDRRVSEVMGWNLARGSVPAPHLGLCPASQESPEPLPGGM